jgi:hypothetical protein
VAIHHLLFLIPRIHGQEKAASSPAQDIWSVTKDLGPTEAGILGAKVDEELSDHLTSVTSRAE